MALVVAATSCRPAPDVGSLESVRAALPVQIDERELGSGQTLGEILSRRLGNNDQAALLAALREQVSPRRLKVGTRVAMFVRPDAEVGEVEIQLNRDETVRLVRGEVGWNSSTERVPVVVDTLTVAGRIDQSLWASIVDHPHLVDMPMNDKGVLVDALDRVFQWQLDFSRQIREGDHFREIGRAHV